MCLYEIKVILPTSKTLLPDVGEMNDYPLPEVWDPRRHFDDDIPEIEDRIYQSARNSLLSTLLGKCSVSLFRSKLLQLNPKLIRFLKGTLDLWIWIMGSF